MPQPRPELENAPEIFYNAREARKYNVSTRIQKIQREMTVRALELMNLPRDEAAPASAAGVTGSAALVNASALLLDVGCGTGISGEVLTERGHAWLGVDISRDMLEIAKGAEVSEYFADNVDADDRDDEDSDSGGCVVKRRRTEPGYVRFGPIHESDEEREDVASDGGVGPAGIPPGPHIVEVAQGDIGQGLPYRPGSFDGCVSVSVIQWLCHSSKKGEVPQRRLMAFFQSLYNGLRRGAKAVLQFYPSSPEQVNMITKAAMKCGFGGGVVVDYPHSTKAKKYYLVLQAGQVAGGFVPPPGLTSEFEDELGELDTSDNEESEEEEMEEDGDDDDDMNAARTRARVAGRDRERVKRNRAASAHGRRNRRKDNRPTTGSKEWVLLKKEERRRRGYKTTEDSKYTMRPRKPRF